MAAVPALSAGILAGGEGRRMGGADKGLVLYRGLPLVRHVLGALADQAAECIVSANRNVDVYEAFGVRVVRDVAGRGPLAGLAALLAAARYDWLLCVPCDAPRLPPRLGEQLWRAAEAAGAEAALLYDGLRDHPTFCLVRCRLAADAETAALAGTGLGDWLQRHGAVRWSGPAPVNLNSADDFAQLDAQT
ncbi:MAG: molybdenum cofactor guanylyltransferase MobA [Legionella sp.]|nr:MAG: molybdenum cofactor guanylyltransferase MobA [Legionella sp.]